MAHRVYMARIPAEVLPEADLSSGIDIAPELSRMIDAGQVQGIATTAQLDGSLVLTVLVDHGRKLPS